MGSLPRTGYTNWEPNLLELAAPRKLRAKSALGQKSRGKPQCLRGRERCAGSDPAQFEHAVADIAVLGQMGRGTGFAVAGHHLIGRAAFSELGVELTTEFTWPAGACVEATDDSGIDVFHERWLLRGRERISPVCESESRYSASADLSFIDRRFCTTRQRT